MTITADEAAEALASIDDVAKRARMALGYEAGAPMLMLWGVIWVICFGVGWLETHHAAVVAWMWLAPIGGLTSCAWGLWRQKFQRDKTAGSIGWLWLAMWGFGILWYRLLGHVISYEQACTYWSTLAMFVYIVTGLVWGRFLLWCGVAITLVAVSAYLWAGPWYDGVMTLAAGGGLLSSGMYLRWWYR